MPNLHVFKNNILFIKFNENILYNVVIWVIFFNNLLKHMCFFPIFVDEKPNLNPTKRLI